MAKVIRYMDGFNHLAGSPRTTLETLCGVCDDIDNRQDGDEFEGEITCIACQDAARIVFASCKKSEVNR